VRCRLKAANAEKSTVIAVIGAIPYTHFLQF